MIVRSPRALVLVAALSAFALPVLAAGEDPVVAVVNGKEIHRSALLEALRNVEQQQRRQISLDQVYDPLLEQVIASELVLSEAKKAKTENDPKVKEAVAEAQNSIMRTAWLQKKVDSDVTEAQVKAKYDELLKTAQPEEQVKARHILVDSEDAAKAVLADLKSGISFEDEAKAKSKDPSGKTNGGDLGYITKNETVPEFSEAAFKLKPGEITQVPVKTQYGWHIIKVEDRRMAPPPTYDEAKGQLRQQMEHEDVLKVVDALKKTAAIKRFKMDGTPADPAAPAAPAAAKK